MVLAHVAGLPVEELLALAPAALLFGPPALRQLLARGRGGAAGAPGGDVGAAGPGRAETAGARVPRRERSPNT